MSDINKKYKRFILLFAAIVCTGFIITHDWLYLAGYLLIVTSLGIITVVEGIKSHNSINLKELEKKYSSLQEDFIHLKGIEEQYTTALKNAEDAIWEWDLENNSFFASDRWYEIMGVDTPKKTDYEISPKEIVQCDAAEKIKNDIKAQLTNENAYYRKDFKVKYGNNLYRWVLSKGKAVFDADGKCIKLSGTLSDVTEIKKSEEQASFLAYYDALTKLPNRIHFTERLKEELSKADTSNLTGAVLFIDLDNFKTVNDTLGHDYGDKLLKQISEKIKCVISEKDTPCRLGGDEFLILLTGIKDNYEIKECAERILKILNTVYEINGKNVYVTGSLGIATFPKDGTNPTVLLKSADAAMYKAKEAGKNNYVFFDDSISRTLERKIIIAQILRTAIKNGELNLHYQPQYDLKTGGIIGLEALSRLNSSELGPIPPSEFIPIAEESGTIIELGEWCLRKACEKNLELKRKGFLYGCISVNISAIQLQHVGFVGMVKRIIKEVGMNPESLEIELTETVLMKSLDSNVDILSELKSMGIKVTLDDFGTGYSSLNYIRKIPLDKLKIDRSFITNLTNKSKNEAICEGIIQMAHNIGLEVIAEGVEQQNQLELLKEMLCDTVQGFLYCPPVHEEELEKVLKDNSDLLMKNKLLRKHGFKYTSFYSRMAKLKEDNADYSEE